MNDKALDDFKQIGFKIKKVLIMVEAINIDINEIVHMMSQLYCDLEGLPHHEKKEK